MKNKSIILVGTAALLLSGCGLTKVKKPTNVVSVDNFMSSLEFVAKSNTLFLSGEATQAYSFHGEMYSEEKEVTTIKSISNKTLEKREETDKMEGEAEFDASSSIIHIEGKEEIEKESNSRDIDEEYNVEMQIQPSSSGVTSIDVLSSIYSNSETDKPFEAVHTTAIYLIHGVLTSFTSNLKTDSTCYIDGDMYTIVNVSQGNSEHSASTTTSTYQLTIKSDSFIVATKREYKETTIGTYYEYVDELTQSSIEVTRKNVSLKRLDTMKMAEGNVGSIPFIF